jgi:hypothetical protein
MQYPTKNSPSTRMEGQEFIVECCMYCHEGHNTLSIEKKSLLLKYWYSAIDTYY